jgi:hypothetical protein
MIPGYNVREGIKLLDIRIPISYLGAVARLGCLQADSGKRFGPWGRPHYAFPSKNMEVGFL